MKARHASSKRHPRSHHESEVRLHGCCRMQLHPHPIRRRSLQPRLRLIRQRIMQLRQRLIRQRRLQHSRAAVRGARQERPRAAAPSRRRQPINPRTRAGRSSRPPPLAWWAPSLVSESSAQILHEDVGALSASFSKELSVFSAAQTMHVGTLINRASRIYELQATWVAQASRSM